MMTTQNSSTTDPASAQPSSLTSRPVGRPRVLDDAARREVCALVAAGCDLNYAARYVGCSKRTVKRECQRNETFADLLRQAKFDAALDPLLTMKQAAQTHWRAAAWLLERTMPARFGRRHQKVFTKRDARRLVNDLVGILRSASSLIPQPLIQHLEERVSAAVEYATHAALDIDRTGEHMEAMMKYIDAKERPIPNPLDDMIPGSVAEMLNGNWTPPWDRDDEDDPDDELEDELEDDYNEPPYNEEPGASEMSAYADTIVDDEEPDDEYDEDDADADTSDIPHPLHSRLNRAAERTAPPIHDANRISPLSGLAQRRELPPRYRAQHGEAPPEHAMDKTPLPLDDEHGTDRRTFFEKLHESIEQDRDLICDEREPFVQKNGRHNPGTKPSA